MKLGVYLFFGNGISSSLNVEKQRRTDLFTSEPDFICLEVTAHPLNKDKINTSEITFLFDFSVFICLRSGYECKA